MTCDRCGIDVELTATVEIRWSFHKDGRTLFGAFLNPGRAKRTLCPKCWAEVCEAIATRMERDA